MRKPSADRSSSCNSEDAEAKPSSALPPQPNLGGLFEGLLAGGGGGQTPFVNPALAAMAAVMQQQVQQQQQQQKVQKDNSLMELLKMAGWPGDLAESIAKNAQKTNSGKNNDD